MQRKNHVEVYDPGLNGLAEEYDLYTCGHCQFQMRIAPPKDPRIVVPIAPQCNGCGKFICNQCYGKGCKTWEKQMEESERKDRNYRSMLGGKCL